MTYFCLLLLLDVFTPFSNKKYKIKNLFTYEILISGQYSVLKYLSIKVSNKGHTFALNSFWCSKYIYIFCDKHITQDLHLILTCEPIFVFTSTVPYN